jgi:hypothetical protein
MRLTTSQRRVLLAMSHQSTLKSHRDIEGNKVYRLHTLDGASEDIPAALVEALCGKGLIDSNKKFPASTYWLTELGKRMITIAPAGNSANGL